ncbi:tetratricopeptide repeat protein [Catellatospora sichuanensis]|uniref:tetratricopeptide repeat protein n=1 Tax=Catellatospora sichuanensis TaxID=1969805 RepID=UPI001183EFCB|nr:tetratricopeptide repeat protein [Catellatospora sichuanensis]
MDARTAESLRDYAEGAVPKLMGLDGRATLADLDRRCDDVRAVIRWFLREGRTDEALRLGSSLAPFWMANKLLDEGSACLEQALAAPGGTAVRRGRAYFEHGLLVFWTGDDDKAASLHRQALEIGRDAGDANITALALTGLARIALRSDVDEARRLCREALAVCDGADDPTGRSSALHVMGVAAQMAGDFVEARTLMNERIALAEQAGNLAAVSAECSNLSMVERQLGNIDAAQELARAALEITYRRGDDWAMPYNINGLAAIAVDRGEFERAATLLGAVESMMDAAGAQWPPDERPHYDRMLVVLPAEMGATPFTRARAIGQALASYDAVVFALGTGAGGPDQARREPA